MNKERSELILSIATEGFWDWDLRADRAYLSPRYCELIGYSPDEVVFDSHFFESIIHPDDRKQVLTIMGEHLQGKSDHSIIEYRMVAKDGTIRWIEGRGKIVEFDAQGLPVRMVGVIVDITERKRTQESLREREEKYRAMVEAFDGYIYICSKDFRIEFMNEKLIKRTGYDATGEYCYKALHDFESVCEWCVNEKVFAGEPAHWEMKSPKDNKWYEISNSAIHNSDGTISKQAMITDITNRKQVEHDLKLFFDLVPDMVCIASVDGYFKIINRAWVDTLGFSEKHLRSIPFIDLVHPDDRAATLDVFNKQLAGETIIGFMNRYIASDGACHWLEWVSTPSRDCSLFYAVARDITARRQAEDDFRDAKRFAEQVIASAQEGIIVLGLDLRYQVWNPFMEKISGLPAASVLGRHPLELFPFLQETGTMEKLEKALTGETSDVLDFPYSVPKTGKAGWASQLISPLRNTSGTIVGVIATVRDHTWRKKMEDELHEALTKTKAANNTMHRLLRVIAHEFRTPLGLLSGSTDILDKYWDRMTQEKRKKQNEHIRSATRQISNLVNSVIAFNFGVATSSRPSLIEDIGNLCRSIAAEVESVWGAGHKVIVSIAADCGAVLLDVIQFRRIVENLLTNAFRYTSSDGVVTLTLYRKIDLLILEISDTGIGIPDEDQQLIFELFYRSSNVESRRGLGLGLSMVKDALSQIGGTIRVNSKVSQGTTMRVEIPMDAPA